jgi:hypothetical protein
MLVLMAGTLGGCAKTADPKRPLEKIQSEVVTMSLATLESNANLYAAAIRAEKAKITKIQDQMRKIPIEQLFNDKKMTREIAAIGQRAEAFFERYQIYVKAFQDKGGDLTKVLIEPGQPNMGGSK